MPTSEAPWVHPGPVDAHPHQVLLTRDKSSFLVGGGACQAAGLAGILSRWPPMSAINSSFPPSAAM
jgi:hypothetical protein